jgi:hypothetical protein
MENLTFILSQFNSSSFDFNETIYLLNNFTKDYDYNVKIIISLFFTFFLSYFGVKKIRPRKNSKKEEDNVIILDSYFNKGLEEFNELESRDLTDDDKEKIKSTEIDETTPIGLVKMRYSLDDEAFIYYADQDISYKYLEVVSRLLVNKLGIKSIYIDYFKELIKARDIYKEKFGDKNNDKNEKSVKNSIYAISNNRKLPENTKHYISPEKSNKYIKKGKLRDLIEENKIKEREENKNKKVQEISFKDFKRNKN